MFFGCDKGFKCASGIVWLAMLHLYGERAVTDYTIDDEFPGGNIVVERLTDDEAFIHQDLRDTQGNWFYWCFRTKGAAGKSLVFRFTKSNVIGALGPGVSTDGGKTWRWLGRQAVKGQSFTYTFAEEENETLFSVGMAYQESHLKAFISRHSESSHLKVETHCNTEKGRTVERLHLGCLDKEPRYRILITSRHHSCEMMANYALEGLMDAVLSNGEAGKWYRENVEIVAIPFMDKDGVEDGDQGKNRKPRDHNRDYIGKSIHPSVKALREFVPIWSKDKLYAAIDLHCPYLSRGQWNEQIYIVGAMNQDIWREQQKFAANLEKHRKGSLPFRSADALPFGQAWNTQSNYKAGKSFGRWASELKGIRLSITIEIPYANVRGKEINQQTGRELGLDLAEGLKGYMEEVNGE
jgi:hypothetical protein